MCFSDQIWRMNPLYIPCQTARLQGKPDHRISWLVVHKSWSRGMTLSNTRCQVRADLALSDLPCLHSTSVALQGIPIASGKARLRVHHSNTHPSYGMEKKGGIQENPTDKTGKRGSYIRSGEHNRVLMKKGFQPHISSPPSLLEELEFLIISY